ncbi:MAG: ABC transporter ATP-binding protein [Ignavibacteria bacterium]|nr:ABC transporter ATP-binding protein [Ignavibacteria bacterium]
MIEIRNIDKRFGSLHVLKGVGFAIERGSITAVVGPNSSGKTTLIKCVLGLVRHDSGAVSIDGVCMNGTWQYRNDIGYMPQIARFPENLTVDELIEMVKDLRNVKNAGEEELIELFRLGSERKRPVRTLSGGTRQKVSAVLALMFNPAILILDEPTAGLDPLASSLMKDRILNERQKGKTIVLTSHNMHEVEELSDKVVFLLDGKVLYDGKPHDLISTTGEPTLERGIARLMENNGK